MRSLLPVNQELLHLIDQISREKGIDKSILVDAIQSAVLSAVRKRSGMSDALNARLDEQTGAITLVASKTVVADEEIDIDDSQINLADAQHQDPNAALGGTIDVLYEVGDFGRIAAQAAKQVIIQKVREAERDMIYHEFKDRQGDLVNGVVSRIEREGNLIVDLGKTEALLPRREQSFRETFKRGDRIRAYIIEVKNSSSGHQVFLSRTHPGFLICLFELEVPEIYEGIVDIKEAVRDSSGRAKIAVMSHDSDVDPVGACVGMKGMRVQAVVQELRGEKIDIIQWTEDREQFVRNALSPAKVSRVHVNEEDNTMVVVVPNDQLSLAIGKRGQNVRLAAKLTHWKIDIKNEDEADENGDRLEALRKAEMMFQPIRRVTDGEDSPAEPAAPESAISSDDGETLPASSAEEPQPPASEPENTVSALPIEGSPEHLLPDTSGTEDDTTSEII
jgi:N utilization substance protein A